MANVAKSQMQNTKQKTAKAIFCLLMGRERVAVIPKNKVMIPEIKGMRDVIVIFLTTIL